MNYLQVVVTEMGKTAKQSKSRMVDLAELAQALTRCPGLGVYIVQDGRFIYANSLFQELTGYTEEEMRSIHPLDLVHPEDREAVREKAIENLKGNRVLPYEYRFMKKNGEIMWNLEGLTSIEYMGKRAAVGSFMDVTDRKRIEAELEMRSQLLHSATDSIFVHDFEGNFVYVNETACRAHGYSREEFMKLRVHDIVVQERGSEALASDFQEMLEKGRGTFEVVHRRKDGSVMPVEVHGRPVEVGGRKLLLVVVRDITERKKAEVEYQTMIHTTMDGFAIHDMEGHFLDVNEAELRLIGYSRDEFLNMSVSDIVADTPEETAEHARKVEEAGYDHFEHRHRRKDGEIIDVEVSVNYLPTDGGRMFVFSRDITARKRAEAALAKSEERYRSVLEQMEEAYYEVDIAGKFTFCNDAMCRQLGYSREELMGMSFKAITPPEDMKRVFSLYNQVYRTGEPCTSVPIERIRKDGTRIFVESSIVTLRNGSGEIIGFRGVASDITKRRQYEQKLAEMATHDSLTGLPNRALLNDRFTVALDLSRRTRNRLVVLMLDLDRFKVVNDSMGHDVGDKLLKAVGKRLEVIMRKSDTVARIGGDEFVVLLPQIPHADEAAKFAQRILDAFRAPFVFNGYRPHITTSIGIAVYPEGGKDIESLLKSADTAMYRAKEQGRDNYRFYDGSEAATSPAKKVSVCA